MLHKIISALQQHSSKYMLNVTSCVCVYLEEKTKISIQIHRPSFNFCLLSLFRSGSTLWRSTSTERMMFWCWEVTACGMSSPTRRQRKRSPLSWPTAVRMTGTGTFPPCGVVAALELPFNRCSLPTCCLAAFMQISQQLDN